MSLLACDAPVTVRNNDGRAELCFTPINPDDMACGWLYTVCLVRTAEKTDN